MRGAHSVVRLTWKCLLGAVFVFLCVVGYQRIVEASMPVEDAPRWSAPADDQARFRSYRV